MICGDSDEDATLELVIDHSVQMAGYGNAAAFLINAEKEFGRNPCERKISPSDTGIID